MEKQDDIRKKRRTFIMCKQMVLGEEIKTKNEQAINEEHGQCQQNEANLFTRNLSKLI